MFHSLNLTKMKKFTKSVKLEEKNGIKFFSVYVLRCRKLDGTWFNSTYFLSRSDAEDACERYRSIMTQYDLVCVREELVFA